MDALSKYPDDPRQTFFGENSTLSIMGQEIGHRWLAFFEFRDHNGFRFKPYSDATRRTGVSFSIQMRRTEGNEIQDLGDGSFRTAAAVQRYSMLDQYAMGLVDKTQVPSFFYVQNPTNVTPPQCCIQLQVGVTFNGIRRPPSTT